MELQAEPFHECVRATKDAVPRRRQTVTGLCGSRARHKAANHSKVLCRQASTSAGGRLFFHSGLVDTCHCTQMSFEKGDDCLIVNGSARRLIKHEVLRTAVSAANLMCRTERFGAAKKVLWPC